MNLLTEEDKQEARLKAFELFGLCMAAGPCNECIFFDNNIIAGHGPCSIGSPNSWPLFDPLTEKGFKNRELVLKFLSRKVDEK